MKAIKLIRGFLRLFVFGVCPKCNHDAFNENYIKAEFEETFNNK